MRDRCESSAHALAAPDRDADDDGGSGGGWGGDVGDNRNPNPFFPTRGLTPPPPLGAAPDAKIPCVVVHSEPSFPPISPTPSARKPLTATRPLVTTADENSSRPSSVSVAGSSAASAASAAAADADAVTAVDWVKRVLPGGRLRRRRDGRGVSVADESPAGRLRSPLCASGNSSSKLPVLLLWRALVERVEGADGAEEAAVGGAGGGAGGGADNGAGDDAATSAAAPCAGVDNDDVDDNPEALLRRCRRRTLAARKLITLSMRVDNGESALSVFGATYGFHATGPK